jgi:hypothetical protein
MSVPKSSYIKRTRRIKRFLKQNYLKTSALIPIAGISRISLSHILNGLRYPKYTDRILSKIENHYSIN